MWTYFVAVVINYSQRPVDKKERARPKFWNADSSYYSRKNKVYRAVNRRRFTTAYLGSGVSISEQFLRISSFRKLGDSLFVIHSTHDVDNEMLALTTPVKKLFLT